MDVHAAASLLSWHQRVCRQRCMWLPVDRMTLSVHICVSCVCVCCPRGCVSCDGWKLWPLTHPSDKTLSLLDLHETVEAVATESSRESDTNVLLLCLSVKCLDVLLLLGATLVFTDTLCQLIYFALCSYETCVLEWMETGLQGGLRCITDTLRVSGNRSTLVQVWEKSWFCSK